VHDWRPADAEVFFRAALAHQPACPSALEGLACLSASRGHLGEALSLLQRAQREEPGSAALDTDGCWFLVYAHRFKAAEQAARRALTQDPGYLGASVCILEAQRLRWDLGAARDTAVALAGDYDDPVARELTRLDPAAALRRWEIHSIARLDQTRRSAAVSPIAYAYHYLMLDDRERALAWLERGLAVRDPRLLFVGVHPDYDRLRAEPRFQAVERQIIR
jgi:tetratricopeptide (TPR) repeat protein